MKTESEAMGVAANQFEDLHVYQRARELTNAVYKLTRSQGFVKDLSLADQIRRASVSVLANIAEGFERGSTTEFVQFLYIAKGSSGEVRAHLQIALDQAYITAQEQEPLVVLARRISGMISNLIAHLQTSKYRGEKFRRPERLAQEKVAKWMKIGRSAQQRNLQAQQEHFRQQQLRPSNT